MDNRGVVSLLQNSADKKKNKGSGSRMGIMKILKTIPMLSTGCKMVALLSRPNRSLLLNSTSRLTLTATLFGHRRGKLNLAIHEGPISQPFFLIELPLSTSSFHKEMASGEVKIALETESRSQRRKLMEENVWAVFCNGRKSGFSIRRQSLEEDCRVLMELLRGVSMGVGVLEVEKEEMSYMRARFERVVGSKDSEAFYMLNPDGKGGAEISIFFVRVRS